MFFPFCSKVDSSPASILSLIYLFVCHLQCGHALPVMNSVCLFWRLCPFVVFSLQGQLQDSSDLQLVVIVNPLSREAQRLSQVGQRPGKCCAAGGRHLLALDAAACLISCQPSTLLACHQRSVFRPCVHFTKQVCSDACHSCTAAEKQLEASCHTTTLNVIGYLLY